MVKYIPSSPQSHCSPRLSVVKKIIVFINGLSLEGPFCKSLALSKVGMLNWKLVSLRWSHPKNVISSIKSLASLLRYYFVFNASPVTLIPYHNRFLLIFDLFQGNQMHFRKNFFTIYYFKTSSSNGKSYHNTARLLFDLFLTIRNRFTFDLVQKWVGWLLKLVGSMMWCSFQL